MNPTLRPVDATNCDRDLPVGAYLATQVRAHSNLLIMILVAALCGICPQMASAQSQVDEYRLKAAFLFHFAQFVEWPPGGLGSSGDPFLICVVGNDPFDGDLEETVQGKFIASKEAQVRHIRQVPESHGCQVVFIGKNESKSVSQFMAALRGTPVLTVGESDDFLQTGGIIRFCMEGQKVRFEVSKEEAKNSTLRVSSRLLRLAKTVVGPGGKR